MKQKEKDFLYGKRSFGKKGQFITVTGRISRFGKKRRFLKGGNEVWRTVVCIEDICDLNHNKLADHLWIELTDKSKFSKGQTIRFEGQVKEYTKFDPYFGGYKRNYELVNIRNLKVME